MYLFSKKSQERLKTCDNELQSILMEVIKYVDFTIVEGYRSNERQEQLFIAGKSKIKAGGKHNCYPSKAVDIMPYPVDWENTKRFYYFAGFVQCIAKSKGINLRWGGDWDQDNDLDDQTFNDLVHFELK